ncbi:hypothetical protein [Microcoleus vaginatus]|uniref:hypothetical protein n=1 Tax=Microcoleus vaginatus TaxID=119532 RepID=UPI001F60BE70
MDATVDAVDLTAVMPGDRPIAQLYTDSRSAIDRFLREKTDNLPLKFSNLRHCGGGIAGGGAATIPKGCISDR